MAGRIFGGMANKIIQVPFQAEGLLQQSLKLF